MAWLTDWGYRKLVDISRASGLVTNYQMLLKVYFGSGTDGTETIGPITAKKIYCDELCEADFSDIRVTTADGETVLDMFLRSKVDSDYAIFWIETDSIGTTDTDFYVYCDNSGASSVSNGTNTFLQFDHFDDGSIDAGIWNTGGTPTESGTTLTLNANNEYLCSKTTWTQNVAIECKANLSSAQTSEYNGFIGFRSVVTTPIAEWIANLPTVGKDAGVNYVTAEAWTADQGASNTERLFHLAWISDRTRYAYDSGDWVDVTTQVPASALPVELYNPDIGSLTSDYILVRQYRSPEPVWGDSGGWLDEDGNPPPSPPSEVGAYAMII